MDFLTGTGPLFASRPPTDGVSGRAAGFGRVPAEAGARVTPMRIPCRTGSGGASAWRIGISMVARGHGADSTNPPHPAAFQRARRRVAEPTAAPHGAGASYGALDSDWTLTGQRWHFCG
jgi:hypothetical protein